MGRTRRGDLPDGWFHVMNRGVERRPVFDNAAHGRKFIGLLADSVRESQVTLHAYCLMPNHFHLLLDGSTRQLSRCMQLLGTNYSRYYNWSTKRDGPLFRSRFHCKSVGTSEYIVGVSRYIHRNPVKRVTSAGLQRYPWSSMRCYAPGGPTFDWLSTEAILAEVGGRRAYAALVAEDFADCPADIGWAIATAAADADLPARLQAKGLDDCIAAALVEGASPALAERLRNWLGCTVEDCERLQTQASRRINRHPELQAVVVNARRLLGNS